MLGGPCAIGGPRCTGVATTGHHVIRDGQRTGELVGACGTCNYGLGRREAFAEEAQHGQG